MEGGGDANVKADARMHQIHMYSECAQSYTGFKTKSVLRVHMYYRNYKYGADSESMWFSNSNHHVMFHSSVSSCLRQFLESKRDIRTSEQLPPLGPMRSFTIVEFPVLQG